MVIEMIEKTYVENCERGLMHFQRTNFLTRFMKIDNTLLRCLEEKNYDQVIEQLDEMCYLCVETGDEENIHDTLQIYYISLLTMQMRRLVHKEAATEVHLSTIYALMNIVKKWNGIKDYLYFTPWFVSKIKELLEESTLPINLNTNVYQAIVIIKNELNNPNLSTAFVAEQLGLSKSYLCYLFKQDFNEPLTKIVREMRLKQAALDIKTSNLSLNEIAVKYGFKSPSYFSRIFRELYGISPMEYRKRLLRDKMIHID